MEHPALGGARFKFPASWISCRLCCYFLRESESAWTARCEARLNRDSEFLGAFWRSVLKYANPLNCVTINRGRNITETDYVHSRGSEHAQLSSLIFGITLPRQQSGLILCNNSAYVSVWCFANRRSQDEDKEMLGEVHPPNMAEYTNSPRKPLYIHTVRQERHTVVSPSRLIQRYSNIQSSVYLSQEEPPPPI